MSARCNFKNADSANLGMKSHFVNFNTVLPSSPTYYSSHYVIHIQYFEYKCFQRNRQKISSFEELLTQVWHWSPCSHYAYGSLLSHIIHQAPSYPAWSLTHHSSGTLLPSMIFHTSFIRHLLTLVLPMIFHTSFTRRSRVLLVAPQWCADLL
jgi:hypothetical protein